VAMKHVREELPDIQVKRPEVSAALAGVIENATAKRQSERYADDAEFISDLEDVLAIETARAGTATGEVTTVLRSLPRGKQRRIPFGVRHRSTWLAGLVVLLLAGGGIAVLLIPRTHSGTGHPPTPPPAKHLQAVSLCQSCAQGFNPLGTPTDEAPDAPLAIDNDPGTYWRTQQYDNDDLNKAGTGLYVNATPGTTANDLEILSSTPGFTVTIYARHTPPPLRWPNPSWTAISASTKIGKDTTIHLTSPSKTYQYYLVWITSLGPQQSVNLNEVTIYHYT
jgi:hypothetical protein